MDKQRAENRFLIWTSACAYSDSEWKANKRCNSETSKLLWDEEICEVSKIESAYAEWEVALGMNSVVRLYMEADWIQWGVDMGMYVFISCDRCASVFDRFVRCMLVGHRGVVIELQYCICVSSNTTMMTLWVALIFWRFNQNNNVFQWAFQVCHFA